jgi:hypothetical protein
MSTKSDEIYLRLAQRLSWDASELLNRVKERLNEPDFRAINLNWKVISQSDVVRRFSYDLETMDKIEASAKCEAVVAAVTRLADIFHECFATDTPQSNDDEIQNADNRAKMLKLAARAAAFNHAVFELHFACNPSAKKGLKECEYHAYAAYGEALRHFDFKPTDGVIYEWIKERGIPGYAVPECETYKRHLHEARRHYDANVAP